jgi:hypothetical protein
MNEISQSVIANLPWKKKNTPSGWISFNAVCCHNSGQRQDDRGRGGLLPTSEGGLSYHCFNCGFTASWQPGRRINFKMRKFMSWLGIADEEIRRLSLFALAQLDQNQETRKERLRELPQFEARDPCPGQSIISWLNGGYMTEEIYNSLELAINYLDSRGLGHKLDQFYWTDDPTLNNRVLVPFTWNNLPMGYSGRLFVEGIKRVKYLSNYPANLVWGYDKQLPAAKFCLVMEGLLDAVSLDGIAICSNETNDTQATVIESLDREVIVVPDRDKAGIKLIQSAMEYGWNVAFPEWENNIKDANAAVARYGQLFTMKSILESVETSNLKIQLMTKRWINS